MKNILLTIGVLMVFGFGLSSFATAEVIDPIPEPAIPESGGGGGSGGYDVDLHIYQDINLQGINIWANASNEIGEGTYGNIGVRIEQGAFGNYYIPEGPSMNIWSWYENPDRLQLNINFRFRVVPNFIDWTDPPSGHTDINAFGLDFYTNMRIEHYQDWVWNPEGDGKGYQVMTDDIEAYGSYGFTDFITESIDLDVRDWEWSWEGKESPIIEKWLEVSLHADLIRNAPWHILPLTDVFPVHPDSVPEPATLLVLAIGGVVLLTRKKHL